MRTETGDPTSYSRADGILCMSRQLAEGLWWIDLGHVNAYLVDDEVLTLIDAGMPWQHRTIVDGVEDAGFAESEIERVLVTHHDFDHTGSLAEFDDLEVIYAGERDADFVAKRRAPPLANRKTAVQRLSDILRPAPSVPVRPVRDGDEIGSFTAMHTPGHTRGHVVYVSEQRNVAFVGDLVMSDGTEFSPSPWYLTEDTTALRQSLAKLAEAIPDVDVVAPGHGDPLTEGGAEALREVAEGREPVMERD